MNHLEGHMIDRISMFVHNVESQPQKIGTLITSGEQRYHKEHKWAIRAALTMLTAGRSDVGIGGANGQ